MKTRRLRYGGFIVTLFFIILFTSPLWMWQFKPSTTLPVLIINKTVPDETYREHKGITWLLNQLKYTKEDGSIYNVAKDYIGFVPNTEQLTAEVRELPEDLSPYRLIYIADTYGVYEEEFYGENELGERSKSLYGGLTMEEVTQLRQSLAANNQTLIAEFNTFGSPTEGHIKQAFYDLVNVRWTGWIGRAFFDLDSTEVPIWVKENYEKEYGQPYHFQGYGIVFVNEFDRVIVLEKESIALEHGVLLEWERDAMKRFNVSESIPYSYWFDIVEPIGQAEVLAHFNLHLSEQGQAQLEAENIPTVFPAVTYMDHLHYDSYYLAGDFVDEPLVPKFYQTFGITSWKKFSAVDRLGEDAAFFWKAFVPFLTQVLKEMEQAPQIAVDSETQWPITTSGSTYNAQLNDTYFEVWRDGEWVEIPIKGVNMGIAHPGSFPGETAITKEEYARWFTQISEMNANAIRVYTIHPPTFYEALAEHNAVRKEPLYLFHGIWLDEGVMVEKQNMYDPEIETMYLDEMKRIVQLLHGDATLEPRPGHASGHYYADVSPYVIGWIIGTEWDPFVVEQTNVKNPTKTSFDGTYTYVKEGAPFEVWLAKQLDALIAYEEEQYGWQRPISFTNWVTTDLLEHPTEPNAKEDMVSVDPNVIAIKETFQPGQFASYHIYPYYPDFLNLEEKYTSYIDHRGEKNNYAGYLNDMKAHHTMPMLVAEFGVPSSRGRTHTHIYGKHQGGLSETEQGEAVVELYEDIMEEEMAGGLVFTWQDEWFKRTWNTMDLDNPDRRPFWDNAQTNEQHFGVLSFDPQHEHSIIHLDGSEKQWQTQGVKPVRGTGPLLKQFITHDERSLIFRFEWDPKQFNFDRDKIFLALDTIPNQGQNGAPQRPELPLLEGSDFVVELGGKGRNRVWVDSYYDVYQYQYGEILKMIPRPPYLDQPNNGYYHPIYLTLNREFKKPVYMPFESYETGALREGTTNPKAPNFDSLADFYVDRQRGVLELRLPWLLLSVADPSQKEVMGDLWTERGMDNRLMIEHINWRATLLNAQDELLTDEPTRSYHWDHWQQPTYHERLKHSYFILQRAFAQY